MPDYFSSLSIPGYPGGPPAFFSEQFGIWINTVSNSALTINNVMIDSLVVRLLQSARPIRTIHAHACGPPCAALEVLCDLELQ